MTNLSSFSSSTLSALSAVFYHLLLSQITDGALRHFQDGNLEFNIIRAVTAPYKNHSLLSQITDGALRHFQNGNLEFNIIRAVTHPTKNLSSSLPLRSPRLVRFFIIIITNNRWCVTAFSKW